jgi:beta-phosphoglucomutase-like phosphatase (HAD superfamily)
MSKIAAIIFDMDGVLIDAKDWHFEALNKALDLFGMTISRYDHLVTFDGLPTSKKLEMLSLERGLPRKLHSFINKMKQNYTTEFIFTRCNPLFQHEFALSRLKAEGYRLAVCSNSIRSTVELMLRRAQILQWFDQTMSNEDVSRPKPDPEMYVKMMQKLEVAAESALILEDNEHGIKAAIDSGAHLLKVQSVQEVSYAAIKSRIKEIEGQ